MASKKLTLKHQKARVLALNLHAQYLEFEEIFSLIRDELGIDIAESDLKKWIADYGQKRMVRLQESYQRDLLVIPIANKAYRLRLLQRTIQKAESASEIAKLTKEAREEMHGLESQPDQKITVSWNASNVPSVAVGVVNNTSSVIDDISNGTPAPMDSSIKKKDQ